MGLEAAVLSSLVDTPPAPHEGSINASTTNALEAVPPASSGGTWAPEYNPERSNCHQVERAYGGSDLTTELMVSGYRRYLLFNGSWEPIEVWAFRHRRRKRSMVVIP